MAHMETRTEDLAGLISKFEAELLAEWLREQEQSSKSRVDFNEISSQSAQFLSAFRTACQSGQLNIQRTEWAPYGRFSITFRGSGQPRAYGPTATFILSLKQPLFSVMRKHISNR